ncbi:hypothetical protein FHR84_004095 [Actinopolyspora biskrensis]|uniref:Uncharacterized protein n=1 Tax=Actinopolyspora biskrensis TaxID=1470178 RepID=A0A852ZDE4_9ACTN|nr:hypothetical protein [Actinopolyspora biskrensis]NYH80727.1 hypothetical protein [Actinopolyspora biskrensis]
MTTRRRSLEGPGELVPCDSEGGAVSLRVSQVDGQIRITTPTIWNRTTWTVEQARQLRDVLDEALRGQA